MEDTTILTSYGNVFPCESDTTTIYSGTGNYLVRNVIRTRTYVGLRPDQDTKQNWLFDTTFNVIWLRPEIGILSERRRRKRETMGLEDTFFKWMGLLP